MLTPENILLLIIFGLLLFNIQTVLSAVIFLFQEIREVVIQAIKREDIPTETLTIIKPYQEFLRLKGFEYLYAYKYNNMLEKHEMPQYTLYFYNAEQHIHAFLDTTPMKGCLQALTINYTTIYEDYNIVSTTDCFAHNLKTPTSMSLFDHYHGSFEQALESHLQDRQIEAKAIQTEAFTEEGCLNYAQYQVSEAFNLMVEENIMHRTENGYRFSVSLPYLKHIHRMTKGYNRASKALARNRQRTQEHVVSQAEPKPLYYNSEMLILEQQLDEQPTEKSREKKIKTFLISVVGFILVFGLLGIPWSTLPLLIVILLVHELGHFLAMRFFGYRDTSIFFIPLFGAAAKGEKDHATPFEEYVVSMAGPLPGIVIGVGIMIYTTFNPELQEVEWLQQYAMFSIILNYINLLPIFPLDGGKIVQSLLFTRYPRAQFFFFLLSLLAIILSAVILESVILGVFAIFLLMTINHSSKTSLFVQSIMQEEPNNTPLKQRVLEKLTQESAYKDISLTYKTAMAKQALKILRSQKPSTRLMLLGLGLYVVLLGLPFI